LIFLNETNILKPPIALTIDRVKSEYTALRRENKSIHIGICRCSDRSLFNNTTIRHLGSLIFNEFENLSHNEDRKSPLIVNTDSKKLLNLFSTKKKSIPNQKRYSSPNRDSGFIETDGMYNLIYININTFIFIDHSLISNSNKHRSKISPEKSEDDSISTQKSLHSSQKTNVAVANKQSSLM
jgi:hypothetical protein